MKTKLLKKLRYIGRNRVTIISVTRTTNWRGEFVTGMSTRYSLPQYAAFSTQYIHPRRVP